jgi:hypothetical protein
LPGIYPAIRNLCGAEKGSTMLTLLRISSTTENLIEKKNFLAIELQLAENSSNYLVVLKGLESAQASFTLFEC